MKKLYIFDCFGVLVSEIAPRWFAGRFEPDKANELKNYYFRDADSGKVNIHEVLCQISRDLNIDHDILLQEWNELIQINRALFEYAKGLRKTARVALLSNAPVGLVDKILKDNNLEDCFDKVFISGECKIVKPSIEFYNLCVNSFGEKFDKIYMIDDNPQNFVELEGSGIIPVTYVDNQTLFEYFNGIDR